MYGVAARVPAEAVAGWKAASSVSVSATASSHAAADERLAAMGGMAGATRGMIGAARGMDGRAVRCRAEGEQLARELCFEYPDHRPAHVQVGREAPARCQQPPGRTAPHDRDGCMRARLDVQA